MNGCETPLVNWVADWVWFAVLRPNNLWQPVPGDHSAFDGSARSWIPQLWTSEHRGWVATGVVALAVSGLLAFLKKKYSHPRDKRSSKLTDVLHEIG